MSLSLRFVSCKQKNVGSCFCFHSLNLCVFIGVLSPLIVSDINDQWLLTLVIFPGGSVCVFLFFMLCWWRVVRCLCYYGCFWLPWFVVFFLVLSVRLGLSLSVGLQAFPLLLEAKAQNFLG